MKLYIWEGDGVLQDWTSGMICALAPDLETALSVIQTDCDITTGGDYPLFPREPSEVIELGTTQATPRAWCCWGGS